MQILLASNNKHKADEIRSIVNVLIPNHQINILIPSEVSKERIIPQEDGKSYFENAEKKARAFFDKFNIPTIADDSGLEVEFINNQPEVNSSSFGGEEGNHKKNRQMLRELLTQSNIFSSKARFRSVFCYIDNNSKFFVEGIVEGEIINDERGENGFGYDSMFIPKGFDKTFAELDDMQKNKISHRFNAVENLLKELEVRNMLFT